jgi:hypothetical protein
VRLKTMVVIDEVSAVQIPHWRSASTAREGFDVQDLWIDGGGSWTGCVCQRSGTTFFLVPFHLMPDGRILYWLAMGASMLAAFSLSYLAFVRVVWNPLTLKGPAA